MGPKNAASSLSQSTSLDSSIYPTCNDSEVGGSAVLHEVVQLTGIPEKIMDSELSELLGTSGSSVNNMTLGELRVLLMNYLETLNEEMTVNPEVLQSKH